MQKVSSPSNLLEVQLASELKVDESSGTVLLHLGRVAPALRAMRPVDADVLQRGETRAHGGTNQQKRLLLVDELFGSMSLSWVIEIPRPAVFVVRRNIKGKAWFNPIFATSPCEIGDSRCRVDFADYGSGLCSSFSSVPLEVSSDHANDVHDLAVCTQNFFSIQQRENLGIAVVAVIGVDICRCLR